MSLKFDSLILNEPVELDIALPQPLSFSKNTYKVLWCLHCAFSNGNLFFERLNLLDLIDNGYVLICPSLSNSYFLNSNNRNVADFLDNELYPYLQDLLPISRSRDCNECLGISMGAYGALNWALRKTQYFCRVVLLSGYYDYRLPDDPRIKKHRDERIIAQIAYPYMRAAFDDKSEILKEDADIQKSLSEVDPFDMPKIDLFCGDDDFISLKQSEYFYDLMKKKNLNVSYFKLPGGHNIKSWRAAIEQAYTKKIEKFI